MASITDSSARQQQERLLQSGIEQQRVSFLDT